MTGVSDATERARLLAQQIQAHEGKLTPEWYMEVVAPDLAALATELEAATKALIRCAELSGEDGEAVESARNRSLAYPSLPEWAIACVEELRRDYDEDSTPGPCLNCGSREQTVVCADCGRLNPAEETP